MPVLGGAAARQLVKHSDEIAAGLTRLVREETGSTNLFTSWVPGNDSTDLVTEGTRYGPQPEYWNMTVEFQGKKVYQRDDLIDPNRCDLDGCSSLDLMMEGRAPIGPDGKEIQLHHMLQTDDGPLAEVTASFHREYSKVIHIDLKAPNQIDRPAFDSWRQDYWMNRAMDYME